MDGSTSKNNALLVAQGYVQQEDIEFDDIFSPVARMETIRTFLFIASHLRLTVQSNGCQICLLKWTFEGIVLC